MPGSFLGIEGNLHLYPVHRSAPAPPPAPGLRKCGSIDRFRGWLSRAREWEREDLFW